MSLSKGRKNYTKQLFYSAMKELLQKQDFDELKVSEICEKVGCKRSVFYYHFADKYDLVAQWFISTVEDELYQSEATPTFDDFVTAGEKNMSDRKVFKKIMPAEGSGMMPFFIRNYIKLMNDLIVANGHGDEINEDVNFSILFHSYAAVYIFRDVVLERLPYSPKEATRMLFENMPTNLRRLIESESSNEASDELNSDKK